MSDQRRSDTLDRADFELAPYELPPALVQYLDWRYSQRDRGLTEFLVTPTTEEEK